MWRNLNEREWCDVYIITNTGTETCECLQHYRYRHTHVSLLLLERILVLALSTQNATTLLLFLFRFYILCAREYYRRNLLAIQSFLDSTNKRECSHIHEFERRMRGIKLQRYLFSSPFSDTCDLVAWTKFTCTYVCICGSLLASGRDLSTSILLFLDDMDCLLHFMLACRDVAKHISCF